MTKLEMATIVATLNEQYHAETTDALISLWYTALGHLEFDEVRKAAIEVLLTYTGTFAPTIGMVATKLKEQKAENEGRLSDGEAYQIMRDAVRRFGRYNPASAMYEIRKASPLVATAVSILGWDEVCSWKVDEEGVNRAHFWRVLAGLRQSGQKRFVETAISTPTLPESVLKLLQRGN